MNHTETTQAQDASLEETLSQFMRIISQTMPVNGITAHDDSEIMSLVVAYQRNVPESHHTLPVSLTTLASEINAHISKHSGALTLANGWRFIPAQRSCTLNNKHISLTEKEAALLDLLANVSSGVKRDVLERCIWNMHGDAESHTLDSHLYRLRQKLAPIYGDHDPIAHENGRYILSRG